MSKDVCVEVLINPKLETHQTPFKRGWINTSQSIHTEILLGHRQAHIPGHATRGDLKSRPAEPEARQQGPPHAVGLRGWRADWRGHARGTAKGRQNAWVTGSASVDGVVTHPCKPLPKLSDSTACNVCLSEGEFLV